MTDEVKKKLSTAKTAILFNDRWIGGMMMSLRFKERTDLPFIRNMHSNIHVFPWDTKSHGYYRINTFSGDVNWDEVKEAIGGGGGTNFRKCWKELEDKNILYEIKGVLFFTDGWCGSDWPPEPDFPVLWILTQDGIDENQVPFGEAIKMPSD